MTVKELKEKAKRMGLSGYSQLRKAELERFIEDNLFIIQKSFLPVM